MAASVTKPLVTSLSGLALAGNGSSKEVNALGGALLSAGLYALIFKGGK